MDAFKRFDEVLYKNVLTGEWMAGYYYGNHQEDKSSHVVLVKSALPYNEGEVIPFNEETKHLLGTCKPYIPWKPERGKMIAVRDCNDVEWSARVFIRFDNLSKTFVTVPHGMSYKRYLQDTSCEERWNYAEPFQYHFETE